MDDRYYEAVVAGWSDERRERFPPSAFRFVPATASTNDDLLARVRRGESRPFELIVADSQDRGRGRRGDRWVAPPGRNLLFSIALPLRGNRAEWARLPHLTARVVGRAVEAVLPPGVRVQAKWPNDLLHQGRKLAGILVERVDYPEPWAVVGVGLNVNVRPHEFPPELEDTATSLYAMLSCESNRWFLLGMMLESFLADYPAHLSDFEPVLDWVSHRCCLTGQRLRVGRPADTIEGVGRGLGREGELLLETGTGTVERIFSVEKIWVCQDGALEGNSSGSDPDAAGSAADLSS